MEPNDLKPRPPDDASLEAWLRTGAALPPLPDDGFTARMLARLPAPAARRKSRRAWCCVAGALAGLAVAGLKISSAPDLTLSVPAFTPDASHALEKLADPSLAVAMAVTLASLSYVFRSNLRRRLQIR